jgi:pimeloyl-ACP methyl ester carboxylesterase
MDFISPAGQAATRLRTITRGHGKDPVLFLHGWSCQASDWDETLAALGEERPVMAVDLPGHGKSADVPWDDWSIIGLAQAVVAVARRAGVSRLTLVGHSMGGTVALEAARLWVEQEGADKLAGVVLVDTFGLPYGDMDAETIASIETPFREDFAGAMHYLVDSTTAGDLAPEKREWIKQRMAGANPVNMLPLWADLLRWSPDRAFAELSCPILALNGEHIPEPARKRCGPHVTEKVMPGCHHFPLFEQPAVFVRELRQVLPAQP